MKKTRYTDPVPFPVLSKIGLGLSIVPGSLFFLITFKAIYTPGYVVNQSHFFGSGITFLVLFCGSFAYAIRKINQYIKNLK